MNTAEYPDLGTMLKNRRQECGLTIEEVANRTRIRRTYLQALEENRFQDLPGEAYISGFLRNYANALGLQQAMVLDMYRGQMADGGPHEQARVLVEQKITPPRRRPKKSWGLLPWLSVALLVIGAFALINLQSILSRPEPLPPREPVAVIDTNPAPPPAPAADAPPTDGMPAGAPAEGAAAGGVDAAAPPAAPEPAPETAKTVDPPAAAVSEEATTVSGEEPLIFDFSGNGLVRLESVGANQIEFAGDNRPPQNYELTASAVLNWKVRQSARISFADPAAVKVWVDQRPLNLTGRGVILLQRKQAPAAE